MSIWITKIIYVSVVYIRLSDSRNSFKKKKKKKTVHSIKMLPIRSNFLGEILFIKTIIQDPSAYVKTSE